MIYLATAALFISFTIGKETELLNPNPQIEVAGSHNAKTANNAEIKPTAEHNTIGDRLAHKEEEDQKVREEFPFPKKQVTEQLEAENEMISELKSTMEDLAQGKTTLGQLVEKSFGDLYKKTIEDLPKSPEQEEQLEALTKKMTEQMTSVFGDIEITKEMKEGFTNFAEQFETTDVKETIATLENEWENEIAPEKYARKQYEEEFKAEEIENINAEIAALQKLKEQSPEEYANENKINEEEKKMMNQFKEVMIEMCEDDKECTAEVNENFENQNIERVTKPDDEKIDETIAYYKEMIPSEEKEQKYQEEMKEFIEKANEKNEKYMEEHGAEDLIESLTSQFEMIESMKKAQEEAKAEEEKMAKMTEEQKKKYLQKKAQKEFEKMTEGLKELFGDDFENEVEDQEDMSEALKNLFGDGFENEVEDQEKIDFEKMTEGLKKLFEEEE